MELPIYSLASARGFICVLEDEYKRIKSQPDTNDTAFKLYYLQEKIQEIRQDWLL